eukprot:6515889-Prymnesium_polylepis.1
MVAIGNRADLRADKHAATCRPRALTLRPASRAPATVAAGARPESRSSRGLKPDCAVARRIPLERRFIDLYAT